MIIQGECKAIDPQNLALDFEAADTEKQVPSIDGGGVPVRFGVAKSPPSALVTLHLANGEVVPAGAEVSRAGSNERVIVGYDGQTFLTDLKPVNDLVVHLEDDASGGFGATISPLTAGTVDTTANLTFSCTGMTPGLPVSLCPSLDAGSAGGAAVPFQIYQDSARTQPWGSAALLMFGAVPTLTGTPGTVTVTATLYGRMWTQATTAPGIYSTDLAGQNFFWGLNLLTCAGVTIGFVSPPATFTFSTTLIPDCQIASSAINFGTAGVLTGNKDGQGGLGVTCTAGTPYNVGLDNGLTGTGPTARRMKKGSKTVTYGLYKNTGRDQPWGLVAQGAAYVAGGTGTGGSQPLAVYGRVPPQATPSPGPYAATVTVTVTY